MKNGSTIDGLPANETTTAYIEYVRGKVSGRRWSHCAGTAKLAAELAGRNGESSVRAAVAGLVHDIARPMNDDDLVAMVDVTDDISEAERQFPVLLHGLVAVKLVREEMACTDEELLFAVRHHTCGHPEMGILGKCLMIGDFAEETRDFQAARAIRAEVTLDVDRILLRVVESRIEYARDSGWVIDPMTVALRDTLRQQTEGKGN